MNASWEAARIPDFHLLHFLISIPLVPIVSVLAISSIFWGNLVVEISELIFRYIKQMGGIHITMTRSMSAFEEATHLREPHIS